MTVHSERSEQTGEAPPPAHADVTLPLALGVREMSAVVFSLAR